MYQDKQKKDEYTRIVSYVRFEVFTAVTTKNVVFWDVALFRSCVNRRSSETSVHARSTQRHIPEDIFIFCPVSLNSDHSGRAVQGMNSLRLLKR
jgi:hypothetical protein